MEASDAFADGFEFCGSVTDSQRASHAVHDWGDDIFVDTEIEEEALDAPVFGNIAEPYTGVDCGADAFTEDFVAVNFDRSFGAGVDVEDGVEEFGAACSDEASDAEDFSGVEIQRAVVEFSWGVEFFDNEPWVSAVGYGGVMIGADLGFEGLGFDGLVGAVGFVLEGFDSSSDHLFDEGGFVDFADDIGGDELAITEDGDAVAAGEDFAHAVGDIDDGEAFGGKVAGDVHEDGCFGDRQRRGGFVEDDDLGDHGAVGVFVE